VVITFTFPIVSGQLPNDANIPLNEVFSEDTVIVGRDKRDVTVDRLAVDADAELGDLLRRFAEAVPAVTFGSPRIRWFPEHGDLSKPAAPAPWRLLWNAGSDDWGTPIASADHLANLVRRIEGRVGETSEIRLSSPEYPRLVVAADAGRMTLTAFLGSDGFYDAIGAPAARGDVELVVGGQTIEVPARFVLTPEQVQARCRMFLESRAIDLADGWVRQGLGAWR
jgi:hypothetical protein